MQFSFTIGVQELTDEYGDLDDGGMDTEGPTTLVYRYSRRKSDSRSDENSQSSKSSFCILFGNIALSTNNFTINATFSFRYYTSVYFLVIYICIALFY